MMEVRTSTGPPESFGWQRRPDLDTPTGLAYEAPDGVVKLFDKRRTPEMVRLLLKPKRRTPPCSP
jgi:hypothetical protein